MMKPNHKFWFAFIMILTYVGIGLLGNGILYTEQDDQPVLGLVFSIFGFFSLFIAYLIGRVKI